MDNRFIKDILILDYKKMEDIITEYGETNEKYFDTQSALTALSEHKNGAIDFSELSYAVNEALENCEVRKYYDIDKSINIIDEIGSLSFPDIGKDVKTQAIGFDAVATMKSNIGNIEACVRSGAYFEQDLTIQHFEELGKHSVHSENGLELNFKVILENDIACLMVEAISNLGRAVYELPLTNEEIKSLHQLIVAEAHKDDRFAYRLGNFYLDSITQSPEFRIIDDDAEYKHGLTLIEYKDSSCEEESNRTTIDLDNPEKYLPVGFPYKQPEESHRFFKSFEELYEIYPDDRSEMSFEDEFEFVQCCYDIYEFTGFVEEFNTPYEDGSEYNGMKFTVDGRVEYVADEIDLECLPMWHITFENGTKLMAHPEEICKIEIEERGKEKTDRITPQHDYDKE